MTDIQHPSAAFPTQWLAPAFLISAVLVIVGILNRHLIAYLDAVALGLCALILFSLIGLRMAKPVDAAWLPSMVAAGFLAKLVFSTGRYLVLIELYRGSGDATGYHGAGTQFADLWRSFQIPPDMAIGTNFVRGLTGLVYVPYIPTMIGGFLLFASLAFVGQLLMYAAYRRSGEHKRLKWYAMALFFIPAISYWPSSIGKESLIFLGLGLAAYGASIVLEGGRFSAVLFILMGLTFVAAIRPHVSALFLGSLAVAVVVSRATRGTGSPIRRLVVTLVVVTASVIGVSFAASYFNIDLEGDATSEIDEFVSNVEGQTAKGGSEVAGGSVSSPADLPEAALRVLFRPLPFEAHNAVAMVNAIENTVLLTLVLWRVPIVVKNTFRIRSHPYALMCLVMTLGFVIAWSPFLNLGLLARQRSQILPFLAVVILQLGWDQRRERAGPEQPAVRQEGLTVG